jgi:hypothetical protein
LRVRSTPKRRDAEASGPQRVQDPKGSVAACDGHARAGLLLLCASPNGSLGTPVTRSPSLPSTRSVFGTRRDVAHEALPPPAIRPRCQLVNVLLPFRSPQSLLHPLSPVKGLKWVMPSSAAVAPWPSRAHWPRPSVSQGTSQGYHLANTMSSRWQVVQRDTQTAVTLLVSPAGPRIVSPANRYVK